MTRWQTFYSADPALAAIPPTRCAQRARAFFARHQKRRLLDLGCGAGRDTICLADGRNQVVGLDAARSGLQLAAGRFQAAPARAALVEGDARRLPFPAACFDGVYCFGVLHEFTTETAAEDVRWVMSEIRRSLRPDGMLILATLSGDPQLGWPQVRMFTEAMFADALAGFQMLEKEEYLDRGCTGRPDYRVWYGAFAAGEG